MSLAYTPTHPSASGTGVTAPAGFSAAGVPAGLKSTGKNDVVVVQNLGPQFTAAGVPHVVPIETNNCFAVMRDPEQHAVGRVGEVPHPTEGHIREPAHMVRVSDSAVAPHRLAPSLGEHTVAILRSVGYTDARIQGLLDRGSALQS